MRAAVATSPVSINCLKRLRSRRAWIAGSWLYIPLTLTTQIALIPFVDFSTVSGVLVFNLVSAAPSLLLNIGLSIHGFRQPEETRADVAA